MKPVFRTHVQSIWKPWDREWLREVRKHANSVCVRIPGVSATDRVQRTHRPDHVNTRNWEKAVKRLGTRPMAFVILNWACYPNKLPSRYGFPLSNSMLVKYRHRSLWMLGRFRMTLNMKIAKLERAVGKPLILHGEDFSCFWLLMAALEPSAWVLDSPILMRRQLEEMQTFRTALDRPGILRVAHNPAIRYLDHFVPSFDKGGLITAHREIAGRVGIWTTFDAHPVAPSLLDRIEGRDEGERVLAVTE